MPTPNPKRRALLLALVFAALVAIVVLSLEGYRLVVHVPGGDRGHGYRTELATRGEVAPLPPPAAGELRNVILLVGDGLGQSQVALGRVALAGANGRLYFERMPTATFVTTHSLSGLNTDSAAAGTALATGAKTENGLLSECPDGSELPTIVELARRRGDLAVGLVTTSYLTDATPAAFVVHAASRKLNEEIAQEMAASGADLLLGERWTDLSGTDDPTLGPFRDAGFHVALNPAELAAAPAEGAVLAVFPSDTIGDPKVEPKLVELARFALDRLVATGRPFFLLVETEETDTASHRHDLPRLLDGIESLHQVSELAVEHAQRTGDTLVLLTGDHDTGAPAVVSGKVGKRFGIRWGTTSHSYGPVPLYAYGPGAEAMAAARDNVDIPHILGELLGLTLPAATCN